MRLTAAASRFTRNLHVPAAAASRCRNLSTARDQGVNSTLLSTRDSPPTTSLFEILKAGSEAGFSIPVNGARLHLGGSYLMPSMEDLECFANMAKNPGHYKYASPVCSYTFKEALSFHIQITTGHTVPPEYHESLNGVKPLGLLTAMHMSEHKDPKLFTLTPTYGATHAFPASVDSIQPVNMLRRGIQQSLEAIVDGAKQHNQDGGSSFVMYQVQNPLAANPTREQLQPLTDALKEGVFQAAFEDSPYKDMKLPEESYLSPIFESGAFYSPPKDFVGVIATSLSKGASLPGIRVGGVTTNDPGAVQTLKNVTHSHVPLLNELMAEHALLQTRQNIRRSTPLIETTQEMVTIFNSISGLKVSSPKMGPFGFIDWSELSNDTGIENVPDYLFKQGYTLLPGSASSIENIPGVHTDYEDVEYFNTWMRFAGCTMPHDEAIATAHKMGADLVDKRKIAHYLREDPSRVLTCPWPKRPISDDFF